MLRHLLVVGIFYSLLILAQARFDALTRTYIVAGQFDKGVGARGEKTNLYSIGLWNGAVWSAVGDAMPNGPIYTIQYVTTCNRLYIGGAFSAIGDQLTGNVAYYDFDGNEWNAVGDLEDWESGAEVHSLSVTCANVGICQCDVAVGGQFQMVSGGKNAAYWKAGDEVWDTLDGGMNTRVYAVKYSRSRVFVGTDNALVYYDLSDNSWKTPFSASINGAIHALAIDENTFSKDQMYFGGNFTQPCKGICTFEPTGDTDPKELADGLEGSVKAITFQGSDIYAAGTLSQNSVRNVAKLGDGEVAWTRIHNTDHRVFDENVNAIWVCQSSSIGCRRGSILSAGSGYNSLAWFNVRDSDEGWSLVGGGVSGPVFALDSTSRIISGASSGAHASIALSVTMLVLYMALM